MQPSEFWSMSIQEWWWEAEIRREIALRMTPGLGGHSKADWAEAHRIHQEKMKARNG